MSRRAGVRVPGRTAAVVRGGARAGLAAAVAASLGGFAAAGAQGGPGAVLLRLRPRAGDTVRTRFEQSVKFLARDGADAAPIAPSGAMTVYAHSVVERADAAGAVLTAVTDSVTLKASGAPAHATESARRAMQGRRSRLRLAPDGATAVLGDAGDHPGGAAMRFPAALPAAAVAPGAMWARAMTVPWRAGRAAGAGAGAPGAGSTIDVWFRFDSLARGGTLAFVSLRGAVRGPGRDGRDGVDVAPAGGVSGALVVDLARGWVVDSRATFHLDGALTAPGGQPRPVRVVVTQRLRVL
jgi:hypothetical protein